MAIGAQPIIKIKTDSLPDYMPMIEVKTKDEAFMQKGWQLCGWSYGTGTDFDSRPFLIDPDGQVRWFLAFTPLNGPCLPIRMLSNGHFIMAMTTIFTNWIGSGILCDMSP